MDVGRKLTDPLVLALASAAVLVATFASAALGAPAGRRPPPSVAVFCSTQFEGKFIGDRRSERGSFVYLCPGDSVTLVAFWGIVPATCREREGRLVGPDLGISVQVDTLPRAPIRMDGSFAFTARSGYDGSMEKSVIRVRGVFDGRTVKGRVSVTTGAWFRYTRCSGGARFTASLKRR